MENVLKNYEDVLMPEDIMEILNIGRRAVNKALRDGSLKSIRIGNEYRIPKMYLIEYIYPDFHMKEGD